MDKEEYRIKLDEINKLVENKDYVSAMKVVDSIDWRKVKNVRTLTTVGEIYAANKRYKDSMDIMLLAYQRVGTGKNILIRLIEISLRGNFINDAEEFYQRFEEIAANDERKHILKYKILKAKNAPIEQRIKELESYKEAEFTEKWSYELARVYYQSGQREKCIDLCDMIILWFYDGKYVMKAMELKKRLGALSASESERYENNLKNSLLTEADKNALKQNAEPTEVLSEEGDKEIVPFKVKVNKKKQEVPKKEEVKESDFESSEIKAVDNNELEKKESSKEDSKKINDTVDDFDDLDDLENEEKETRENLGKGFQVKLVNSLKEIFSGKKKIFDDDLDEGLDDLEEEDFRDLISNNIADQNENLEDVPKLEPEMVDQLPNDENSINSESNNEADFVFKQPEKEVEEEKKDDSMPDLDVVKQILDEKNDSKEIMEEEQEKDSEQTEIKQDVKETEIQENAKKIVESNEDAQEDGEKVKWAENIKINTVEDDKMVSDIIEATGMLESQSEEKDEDEMEIETVEVDKEEVSEDEKNIFDALEKSIERQMEKHLKKTDLSELEDNTTEEIDLEEKIIEPEEVIEPEEEVELEEEVIEPEEEVIEPEEEVIEPEEEVELEEEVIEPEEKVIELEKVIEEAEVKPLEDESVLESQMEEKKASAIVNKKKEDNSRFSKKILLRKKELTEEEKVLFTYFATIPGMKEQILNMLYDMQVAAADRTSKTGNIVVMGAKETGKTHLISKFIPAICKELNMEATKVAYVFAEQINGKNMAKIIDKLSGGFLVIENASELSQETVENLNTAMEFRTDGLTLILEDEKVNMRKFLAQNPKFSSKFTSMINIPVFTNVELANFATVYVQENGYKIDELGMQALYYLISQEQKEDEPMTIGLVKELIDDAITKSQKRKLFSKKKVSDDGFVVLGEKDFN